MISLEVPRKLPIDHLSHSSLRMYYQCPMKWYKRYIEMEYEPTNSRMLIGKAVGGGASAGYVSKRDGSEEYGQAVLDVTSDIVDEVIASEEIADIEETSAGEIKDTAIACVGHYYDRVMTHFHPRTVEEGFRIDFPEADWHVQGYIDITGQGPGLFADLHDIKVIARANNAIDDDVQATLYVASRFVKDGSLPGFAWHQIKKPTARNGVDVSLLTTTRTATQVTNYMARVAQVAREIEWRNQTGNWQGAAPGSYYCSEKQCGYWSTCPFGGAK